MNPSTRIGWGLLLCGVAAGAALAFLVAKQAPRWKRKAQAGVGRGREAAAVLRDALEVFHEFRDLGRPLDEGPVVEVRGSYETRMG